MSIKLLIELNLEFLCLTGGCTGSSECTLVKMAHCWKSHVTALSRKKKYSDRGGHPFDIVNETLTMLYLDVITLNKPIFREPKLAPNQKEIFFHLYQCWQLFKM